jgi:hypothetical protein
MNNEETDIIARKEELKENIDYFYNGLLNCFSLVECFHLSTSYDPEEISKYPCVKHIEDAFVSVLAFLWSGESTVRDDLIVVHSVFGHMMEFIMAASQASLQFKKAIIDLDPNPITDNEKYIVRDLINSSMDSQEKVHDIVTRGDYYEALKEIMLPKFEEAIRKIFNNDAEHGQQ